jgi:hypothetical protein
MNSSGGFDCAQPPDGSISGSFGFAQPPDGSISGSFGFAQPPDGLKLFDRFPVR